MGKTIYLCLVILTLTGCASVPMGAMWKMYRLGPEGIIQTSPEDVRAAVLSENELLDLAIFDMAEITFVLTRPGNVEHTYAFDLTDTTEQELDRLTAPLPDQQWRVYAISPDQFTQFSDMQEEVGIWYQEDKLKGSSIEIMVDFGFDDFDPEEFDGLISEGNTSQAGEREFPFRLDVQIDPADGYFTLIEDRHLVFSANSSSSGD